MTGILNEVEIAHRQRLPRMKRSKTGAGSFYTHIMVRPGGIEGLGQPDYRVARPHHLQMMTGAAIQAGMKQLKPGKRKEVLKAYSLYYGKKVAV